MWRSTFHPMDQEIAVHADLFGRLGKRELTLIFDTGSPVTIIDTDVVHLLGYSPRDGKGTMRLYGIGEPEECFILDVDRLDVMGRTLAPCRVVAQDLPFNTHGVIGLDLMRQRLINLDLVSGVISVSI